MLKVEDVLSGILLTFLMQHGSIFDAINNSCFIHGKAADLLIEDSHTTTDLLASDVIEGLPRVFCTFI